MAGSYNPLNQNQNNYQYNFGSTVENKGFFSRALRDLSNWGMRFDDMVLKNTVGVGMNEDPFTQKGNSMYDFFSQKAVASVLNKKAVPYLDRAYSDKRRILREYSIKDEIRDFVATIADESIIYNDDRDFCSPRPLSNDYSQEIRDKYQEYFEKIYNKFGFADSITAWTMMKDFLIDGFIAVEIIYDDKKKNIIAFNRLRPETIVPAYEPSIGNLWIQFPEDPQLRRIFLDSQIIFVSYSTQNDYNETSYVEGLIKPYNKQVWFPEGDAGTPNMELVSPEGHNLNESDILTWFYNGLKRACKIPFQRFEKDNGGGNMFSDAAEMTRDEVKFSNFVGRLRAIFKEIIVKPMKVQMLLEFPELKDDEVFLNQIDIVFNSNQLFEEWKKLGNMQKRSDIMQTLLGIQKADGQPYFHIDYLIDHVMKLSPEEKEENKSYWIKGAGAGAAEGGGETGAGPEGGAGPEIGGPEGGAGPEIEIGRASCRERV